MAFETVPANDRISGPYMAGAGQTVFNFDFPAYQVSEVAVMRARAGANNVMALGPDYTIILDVNGNGGAVTLSDGAVAGDKITIYGNTGTGRETAFDPRGDFASTEVNRQLNRLHMRQQEIARDLFSALRAPIGETLAPMPPLSDMAGKYLYRDISGNIVGADAPDLIFQAPVANIVALRASVFGSVRPQIVLLLSSWQPNDGVRTLVWDPLSEAVDNGGTIIKDAAALTGRWVDATTPVQVKWFGSDSAAVTAALAVGAAGAAGAAVIVSAGAYVLLTAVLVPAGSMVVIEAGAVITGAGAASLIDSPTGTVVNLALKQLAYPVPVGQAEASFSVAFKDNYSNLQMTKYLSGGLVSNDSDGRFPTVNLAFYNDGERDTVADWYHVNGACLFGRTYHGLNAPARGTSLFMWGEVYAFNSRDHGTNNVGGEICAYHGTVKPHWDTGIYNNGSMNIWGHDLNVGGPNYGTDTAKREGSLFAASFTVAKLTDGNIINVADPHAAKRGSGGATVATVPGIGLLPFLGTDSWVGKKTYPVRAGYHVSGYSGAYDGPNSAMDGYDADAARAFDVAFWAGGYAGPWFDSRSNPPKIWNSRIGTGFIAQDYEYFGFRFLPRLPGSSAASLMVERNAGAAVISEEIRHPSFRAIDSAAFVNFSDFMGSATGGYNRIIARGADPNISLSIEAKGLGRIVLAGTSGAAKVAVDDVGLGFYGANPAAKPSITGSRAANAALASLLTQLAGLGLITDATTV